MLLFSEAVTHASENISDTDAHGLLVELKATAGGDKKWPRARRMAWRTTSARSAGAS